MNIEILQLHPDATISTYGSEWAACFDLASIESGIIPARGRKIVRTGLAFAVPPGYALDVRSRSGLAELGFEPVARDKAARLYRASDFAAMCRAIASVAMAAAQPQEA